MARKRVHWDHDWYPGGFTDNVKLGEKVYIDTSYGFHSVFSERDVAIDFGDYSTICDRSTFVMGENAQITVGKFTLFNNNYLYCNDRITIGDHVLLAWGVSMTDTWIPDASSLDARRAALASAAKHPERLVLTPDHLETAPITIEDNVWVGFECVLMPGVTLGQGAIVGCKTYVDEDVPPYAVVVGNPSRIVRYLDPTDTEEARRKALEEHVVVKDGWNLR